MFNIDIQLPWLDKPEHTQMMKLSAVLTHDMHKK